MFKHRTRITAMFSTLIFVAACSDDAPAGADAAACVCAPSEPPLTGRLVRVEDRRTSANAILFAVAACPDGAVVIGGGCYTEGIGALDPDLISSGGLVPGPEGYRCVWRNLQMNSVDMVAWAMCLVPASQ